MTRMSVVDFVDEVGDSWEEYVVFHHKFKQWMSVKDIDTEKNYTQEELTENCRKIPLLQSHFQ